MNEIKDSDSRDLPPFDGGVANGLAAKAVANRTASTTRDARYLTKLNSEQIEAVATVDGPLLVLAGAGTGKTSVLTARVAHLLAIGAASPYQILAVTFTNKAAREIRQRVRDAIGNVVEGMEWLGTFHSLCAKILRRHGELVGLRSNFTILDKDDQIRLLKQLLAAHNIDEKRWPARYLAAIIDNWKNRALEPEAVPGEQSERFGYGRAIELYQGYQDRLRNLNAVDFGDLLLKAIAILKNDEILLKYSNKFKYIMVDEYQDTNIAQYLWLRLLAQAHGNICCVGDDDQSIYGWRGAEVDNILRFEKDFPGAKVIRLERNYRSTGHILKSAAHLIAHNNARLGKTLFTVGDDGEKIRLQSFWDSQEEARGVVDAIEKLQRTRQISLDEIAILVRASFQMRELEDRFTTIGLAYRVIGGPRFYERAEIRDALAYIRIVAQPNDDLALERILNVPRRGLGVATLRTIHIHARSRQIPLLFAGRELITANGLRPAQRNSLVKLITQIDNWQSQAANMPPSEVIKIILEESGYIDMWRKDKNADAPGRLENIKELVRSIEEFPSLHGFLEHVSLLTNNDANGLEGAVNLMTLHAAKGLEFDVVFLPGWEEGLFPHQRCLDEQGARGLEEERRLAYVGLTRARKRLFVSFAASRFIHGYWQASAPSRFVDELPEDSVEIIRNASPGGYGRYDNHAKMVDDDVHSAEHTPGYKRLAAIAALNRANKGGSSRSSRSSPMTPTRAHRVENGYKVGDKVRHLKFGIGNVRAVNGDNLSILFVGVGLKKVLASFITPAKGL